MLPIENDSLINLQSKAISDLLSRCWRVPLLGNVLLKIRIELLIQPTSRDDFAARVQSAVRQKVILNSFNESPRRIARRLSDAISYLG